MGYVSGQMGKLSAPRRRCRLHLILPKGAAATPPLNRPTGLKGSLTDLITSLLDGWLADCLVDWFDYLLVGRLAC